MRTRSLEMVKFRNGVALTVWALIHRLELFGLCYPGISFAADPRLFENIGGAILYLGTLGGVFLLARLFFGVSCASLAVILYGLSELGLYFAGSLWPKGHPFFYVWMLYFASQWVNRSDLDI